MISRRNFLSYSILGALTVASGCRPANYQLSEKTTSDEFDELLGSKSGLANNRRYFLGYPVNLNTPPQAFFDWRKQLQAIGLGNFAFNNVGNPFAKSTIPFSTHDPEKEIILRFGELYGFQNDNIWGFLSHSGTDSNMHGMYMGRTLLQGTTGKMPKCYFTREAHYSIQILSDLLGLETIYVNTLANGGMDPEDLARKTDPNNGYPVLLVATIGTTFKGAIDDLDLINQVLTGKPKYIHLDAALFGGYLPHTMGAGILQQQINDTIRYNSLAVSCHKFFGFYSPAGLFIANHSDFKEFNKFYSSKHNPEYIGHVPGTITCSRDAVKPAEFYYFSSKESLRDQAKDARTLLKNTTYLFDQLQQNLPQYQATRSNQLSNTIYFRNPGDRIVEKYTLATMHLPIEGKMTNHAHVVVMPHVSKDTLDEFLNDLQEDKFI